MKKATEFWGVSMCKDELDVLPYTIQHLVDEGLDGIVIADNMSTDGTREWLRDHAESFRCPLVVLDDTERAYYQSTKMTFLLGNAMAYGATWILPFDADEFWYNPDGPSLWETVDSAGDVDCLQARLFNYFPMTSDGSDPNPFERITCRGLEAAPLPKVIVKANEALRIHQGNHDADIGPRPMRRASTPITVAHFPWRSPHQFERKVRNGYAAYQATDLPPEVGAHWRQYGQILEDQGPEALRNVYDEWFSDPRLPTIHDPVPWGQIH